MCIPRANSPVYKGVVAHWIPVQLKCLILFLSWCPFLQNRFLISPWEGISVTDRTFYSQTKQKQWALQAIVSSLSLPGGWTLCVWKSARQHGENPQGSKYVQEAMQETWAHLLPAHLGAEQPGILHVCCNCLKQDRSCFVQAYPSAIFCLEVSLWSDKSQHQKESNGFPKQSGLYSDSWQLHGQEVSLGDDPLLPVTKLQVSIISKEQRSLQRWSHVCCKKILKLNCSPL